MSSSPYASASDPASASGLPHVVVPGAIDLEISKVVHEHASMDFRKRVHAKTLEGMERELQALFEDELSRPLTPSEGLSKAILVQAIGQARRHHAKLTEHIARLEIDLHNLKSVKGQWDQDAYLRYLTRQVLHTADLELEDTNVPTGQSLDSPAGSPSNPPAGLHGSRVTVIPTGQINETPASARGGIFAEYLKQREDDGSSPQR